MDKTLKVTNVLGDPTRYSIYESFLKRNQPLTVNEVAELFDIHPNVARLHLTKLTEINVITAQFKKTGKGGRPSRVYELSDQVIELTFPHRDYKMLAEMMLETFAGMGELGKKALFNTGKKYGMQITYEQQRSSIALDVKDKVKMLEETGTLLGMYPKFEYDDAKREIHFTITNCPFKELAQTNTSIICNTHMYFLKGMLSSVFPEVKLVEKENMLKGCNHCRYTAELK